MKQSIFKIIACMLACLMLLGTAACNKKEEEKKPSQDTSSVTSSVDDTSSEELPTDDTVSVDDTVSDDLLDLDNLTAPQMPNINTGSTDSTESTEEEIPDATEVDANDKPFVDYPAYLTNPMKSLFDKQADALRSKILNNSDKLPSTVTGTIWYVSNKGDDINPGNSKDKPWATIFGMNFNKNSIKAGDAVLFERGGVYRGSFTVKDGVYYGAYGTGDKPCIYGSEQNYAKASWRKKHGNLWVLEAPFQSDIGTIVFNHGELVGYKKVNNYDLEENGDFWCDNKNNFTLYMYMDKNPAEKYKSIEIGTKGNIISAMGAKNVTIENLCIKYTGGHAISAGGKDCDGITVRGCEIGFIGGSYLSGTLRYGNAVEFYAGGSNALVEKNWIYQIYDSGITNQGENFNYNILMQDNLIEYCGMGSYEYWLAGEWNVNRAENISFINNICRFAGYCWGGEQRADKCSTHIRSDVTCRNTMFNFVVKGNIFDQSSENLLEIGGTAVARYEELLGTTNEMTSDPTPQLSGNIYAQSTTGYLGTWFSKAGIIYDGDREDFIRVFMGDEEAVIYTY